MFGIADDLDLNTGSHTDLIQNNLTVSGLPHGACAVSPVVRGLIAFHDSGKISQSLTELLHLFIADFSVMVGISSQGYHMAHMIQLSDFIFAGNLIDSHFQLKGAHVNGGKYMDCHNSFPRSVQRAGIFYQ